MSDGPTAVSIFDAVTNEQGRAHSMGTLPPLATQPAPSPTDPIQVPQTGWHEASRRALLAHHAAGGTGELAQHRFTAHYIFPTGGEADTEQLDDVEIADMIRGLAAAMTQIDRVP